MTKFILGFLIGLSTLTVYAQSVDLNLENFYEESKINVEKKHDNKRIENLIATSTLEIKEAEFIIKDEDNTKEITKRLDRIIEILESR